jgi:anti-sigma factor RsiW
MQRTDDTVPDFALDPELQAYVDGKLSPEAAAAVEARLAGDEAARRAAADWQQQRRLIRAAAEAMDTRPDDIRTLALERELSRRLAARRRQALIHSPRLRQLAASVALFALGWFAHDGYGRLTETAEPGYVANALSAHRTFAYDAMRPVEFAADEMDDALEWLSTHLSRALFQPKLEEVGLTAVGARLVGTAAGPAGLLLYEDESGERVSILVAAHAPDAPILPLRVVNRGTERVAFWSDESLDYAVLGTQDHAMLTRVAAAVSLRD